MTRPTTVSIDFSALTHNLECVRRFAPDTKVIAMVKANAYGHGMIRATLAFSKAEAIGVASLEEALQLREAGVKQPIVLMEGVFAKDELQEAEHRQLTLVVHHEYQVSLLEAYQAKRPFPLWLKINTGMHRLGVMTHEVSQLHARLMVASSVAKPIGLMTHFAKADDIASPATSSQINQFSHVTQGMSGPRSLSNSAGILAWPLAHGDWVRPGVMLYGVSPFKDKCGLDYGLQPVMTLASRLISLIPVKRGGQVGYGGTWTASADTLVGIVAAGYGDGYPQTAQNGTPVLVNGKRVPLVGRVSMDMLAVDLSSQPEATIGDKVILWGAGLPVEEVARASQSSPYELLTRLTARPRAMIANKSSELIL